jgi:tryptophan synthase alpha chain
VTTQRIEGCFRALRAQGRTALVAYVTVGEPSVEESIACARAALEAGVDILGLGVPFSDPTADGPVIAAASHRAIQRGGSLRAALRAASEIRAVSTAPIVLFTYYNPVLAFGDEQLPKAAADAGADALLVVDLPPEEGAPLRAAAEAAHLGIIPLVAPTTLAEREPRIFASARGFVYYVAVTGVTGSAHTPFADAGQKAAKLRERSGLPVVVGFGIRTAEDARKVAEQGVDGVVVGTELIRVIGSAASPAERLANVRTLVSNLRAGLDAARRTAPSYSSTAS